MRQGIWELWGLDLDYQIKGVYWWSFEAPQSYKAAIIIVHDPIEENHRDWLALHEGEVRE